MRQASRRAVERHRLRREREQTRWPDDTRLRFILFAGLPQGDPPLTTTLWRCIRAIPAAYRPSYQEIADRAARGQLGPEVTYDRETWGVHLRLEIVRRYGLRAAIGDALREGWIR